ncbi:MAG TPA: hypothetical protein PLB21_12185, partial [Actinomycetota bacterium]|nr:hypothetical protein [Actinomycetota bacterium]
PSSLGVADDAVPALRPDSGVAIAGPVEPIDPTTTAAANPAMAAKRPRADCVLGPVVSCPAACMDPP